MTDKALRLKLRKQAREIQIKDFRSGQEDTLVIMPTGAGTEKGGLKRTGLPMLPLRVN